MSLSAPRPPGARVAGGFALASLPRLAAAIALTGGGFFFGARWGGREAGRELAAASAREARVAGGGGGGGRIAPARTAAEENPAGWDQVRWDRLNALPGSKTRSQSLAALLEKLAETDPDRALALARAEGNLLLRRELMKAVLRGWAHADPDSAARWVLAQPADTDRSASMALIFSQLEDQPDAARRIAAAACQADPGAATNYGGSMIDALCEGGDFAAAANFAQSGEGGVQQGIWLAEAFSKWSAYQPQSAAQAAADLSDPTQRLAALHGVVGGWSETDPAGLTGFLAQLPAGPDRTQMLGQAIRSWSVVDPDAVSSWISTSALGSDADGSAILVSAMASVKPEQAANWAQSIADPQQRSSALLGVLKDWVSSDPTAAKLYFESTQYLLPADRDQAAGLFQDP